MLQFGIIVLVKLTLPISVFVLFIIFAVSSITQYTTTNAKLVSELEEDIIRSFESKLDVFDDTRREYEGYDGWYNNRASPSLGATDTPLSRRLPVSYTDGVYSMTAKEKPNPFDISWNTMRGPTGKPSFQGRTAFLTFFGQQIVDEIVNTRRAGCPVEYKYIDIPEWHEFRRDHPFRKTMPFVRSRYSSQSGISPNVPRNQLNEHTPWIDGGIVYGTTKAWSDQLRSFKGGRLADNAKEGEPQFPERNTIGLPMINIPDPVKQSYRDAKSYFKLGNPHGAENPFLLSLGILWFRWHNYWADKFHQETDWGDEMIYQEARKWVIATYQKFVFYDWLPAFIDMTMDEMEELRYTGYKSYILPGVSHEFQAAAMRWGHTLVPPGVYKRNTSCHFLASEGNDNDHYGVRTCNVYWNAETSVREGGIEPLLMGMASQITEREDNIIAVDLQSRVYGPLNFVRRDLMVQDILRGRDHGLPDYNTARDALGLKKKESFLEINPYYNDSSMSDIGREALRNLEEVYQHNIDEVEMWAGGLFETTAKGPGELFRTIILDQFIRIRDGDRFWFENERNGLFTKDQINYIHNLTMSDVITRCTNISAEAIQADVFHFVKGDPCWDESVDPQQGGHGNINRTVSEFDMENCTGPKYYDYFTNSEVSYALTFTVSGVWIVGCVVTLFILAEWRKRKVSKLQKLLHRRYSKRGEGPSLVRYNAAEWIGPHLDTRPIRVVFGPGKQIQLYNEYGNKKFRHIDLSGVEELTYRASSDRKRRFIQIEIDKEYDLIVRFDNEEQRKAFISDLRYWLEMADIGINGKHEERSEKKLLKLAITKGIRQKTIEKFLRIVIAQAVDLDIDVDKTQRIKSVLGNDKQIVTMELTKSEFAEALSLQPKNMFVTHLFRLAAREQSGTICLREFLDVLVLFAKGKADDKMRLMFKMYDLNNSGFLHRDEFKVMLKSMMEMANVSLEPSKLEECIDTMFVAAGFENKVELSVEDFIHLMAEHKDEFNEATLNIPGFMNSTKKWKRKSKDTCAARAQKGFSKRYQKSPTPKRTHRRNAITDITPIEVEKIHEYTLHAKTAPKVKAFFSFIENRRMHTFWIVIYIMVLLLIFAERVYTNAVEREHTGLRRIVGYSGAVARATGSVIMFTYSSLFVTMCRNLITKLRETFLNHYIPFDAALAMHQIIAYLLLLFTVLHIVAHALNFYHISTLPPEDLSCYFSNLFQRSHTLPNFQYWCWNTITGSTGVLLVLVFAVIYTFATKFARRRYFSFFWITHSLYTVASILTILHGVGQLTQKPHMWFYFLGPAILFTIDKLISFTRKKQQITVVKAELLPSNVTHLRFKRPRAFEYKSGQWVRIACIELGGSEYHPFTLSSAPHEEYLSLHIRALGPWTINLRRAFDPALIGDCPYPKLYLDGPFGEGHQDWYKHDVSVLIGAGIGVTPFASILKDIAYMSSTRQQQLRCKKVHFIWVTRTQKQFEWLTDIIRQVEIKDTSSFVSIHLFITQFHEKFDLRTTMLYICERHFQKVSDCSLFTGLRSTTHFGRPNFITFLNSLQNLYSKIDRIGVFSCGPPGMTRNVEQACADLNKFDKTAFIHHYENF